MFIVIGAAIVTLGAGIATFLIDSKTEKIKKENDDLEAEIDNYSYMMSELQNSHYEKIKQKQKEQFFILKEEIYRSIDVFYKENKKRERELKKYLKMIANELDNPNLSSFYKEETAKSKNIVLVGLNKVKAYYRYLEFYKIKIKKFEETEKYHLIFELPTISGLLPEEYLYFGKLAKIEKSEINKYTRYSQKFIIDPLDKKYLKDENYVFFDRIEKGVFIASISKGELALNIKEKTSFEAEVLDNELGYIIPLKYKNIELKLNVKNKLLNKKLLKSQKIEVSVDRYDYFLNYVYVTQKTETINLATIYIINNTDINIDNEITIIKVDNEQMVLKSNNYIIITLIKNNYLEVIEIEENQSYEVGFSLDVDFKILTNKQFFKIKDLVLEPSFRQFVILAINEYESFIRNKENIFIKKYADILDYQIEVNKYDDNYIEYELVDSYKLKIKDDIDINEDIIIEINNQIYSIKDYSIEDKIIILEELNSFIPKKGLLNLKTYTYPYTLIQQKRALNKFIYDEIVNKSIKSAFISPSAKKFLPMFENIDIEFKNINLTKNQKEIVLKSLQEKDLFLIQGPPGTGKTTVIKEIIYQTLKIDKNTKILVVSQQNVAVDNVLEGLEKENISQNLLRIATNVNKVYSNLQKYTIDLKYGDYKKLLTNLEFEDKVKQDFLEQFIDYIKDKEFKELEDSIKEIFIKKDTIIGATCIGLSNKRLGLEYSEFDLVIIDEAGRATLGELIIPILKAKKVILIGDHKQLPPTSDRKLIEKIESDNITKEDLKVIEKSYFEELFENIDFSSKGMLKEQFRMPNKIGSLISELFYENRLKNGVDRDVKKCLNWINVKGKVKALKPGWENFDEVKVIKKLVKVLPLEKSIAIITPYSAQKRLLRQNIKRDNLKIDTVDSFQGEEADIVIYSTVRTYGNIMFLLDERRLNVAISRTKEKLFFVGDREFFYKNSYLFKVIINNSNLIST